MINYQARNSDVYTDIQLNQYVLFPEDQAPLSLKEFKLVASLLDEIDYEVVRAGDAGDEHALQVGRFRRDIERPVDLHPSSEALCEIIDSPKMQKFYQQVTGFEQVCIRRAQANILESGSYVGLHIDGVGDPKYKGTHADYKYAVVLHFDSIYEGGDTVLHTHTGKLLLKLPNYSMLIITGALPHEVKLVTSGQRRTLVYFLSDNFGLSKSE